MHKCINDLVKQKPLFMGILNVTPDSFSDGGKYFDLNSAINHAKDLINQGIHIIDIGGESTRPDATPISEEEELKRVIPVIKELAKQNILISIDTYKSKVAKAALEAGASMINDVSGLTMDKDMVNIARDFCCPIIIMHNTGIPAKKTSASNSQPSAKLEEVISWLRKQINYALNTGIKKENIIIDPGIGFGKTAEEDLFIIKNISQLKALESPVLVGPSKKSFLKKVYGENIDLEKKTKEIVDLSINNGASIVRVHSF